jgi:hypothetical protein
VNTLQFDDKVFNPFIGAGSLGMCMDDFNGDNFDHSGLGFIGGAGISASVSGGRPIQHRPVPPGTPRWGAAWKSATRDNYQRVMSIGSQGSSYAYRGCVSGSGSDLQGSARPPVAAHDFRLPAQRHQDVGLCARAHGADWLRSSIRSI